MPSLLTTRRSSFKERKIKSLKDFWSGFFRAHEAELAAFYPGIQADRFLREVKDILSVPLENSLHSFSQVRIRDLSKLLLTGKPFPYLLNESEFFHHRFYVNEKVLIPRPETELLVDMITKRGKTFQHVLDIGTGSGVLLLSLVKAGVATKGTGGDISPEALTVAKINQRRLRLEGCTDFVLSDRLQKVSGLYSLIVSNPPYIRATSQRSLVQESVHAHEPHKALYLPDAEYDEWFRNFFSEVKGHLTPGGEFWMEGHELEVSKQSVLLKELGFTNVKVLKDYAGLDRFLHAELSINPS